MLIYFLYQYCRRLEENDYQGKPADMAYMLMILFSTTSKYYFHFIEIHFEKVQSPLAVLWIWLFYSKFQLLPLSMYGAILIKVKTLILLNFLKVKLRRNRSVLLWRESPCSILALGAMSLFNGCRWLGNDWIIGHFCRSCLLLFQISLCTGLWRSRPTQNANGTFLFEAE